MSNKDERKGLALGALFGAVAGFLTGILTAPKSGKETRKEIKETAEKLTDSAEKELKTLYRQLSTHGEQLKVAAAGATKKAKDEFDQLSVKLDESKDKIKELLSTIRDGESDNKKIQKVIDQAKKLGDEIATKVKK